MRIAAEIKRLAQRHTRFLNDTWIFIEVTRPELLKRANVLLRSSNRLKWFEVPKDGGATSVHRRNADIGQIYKAQHERGIFENNIIGIVSRTEAFIQECLIVVIREYPQKLKEITDGKGIPIDLFLEHDDRSTLLERFVAGRCQALMFGKPSDYLEAAAKVLSIEINRDVVADYIEIKASRDIVVHNLGNINQMYVDKAGRRARGRVGNPLELDQEYFRFVVDVVKGLTTSIATAVKEKYSRRPARVRDRVARE
jgi:hypothetical protein